ncbi:riboflavin kinase [Parasteatoda tepidariorum]|uniref:riboflavin kinase n=1 Tax=Parasteatoda tepidariorum TaxID=114398 RepID=UPI001C720BD2|nr:riboflavin kinase [Parasteatoda tepidariorum]
MFSTIPNGYHKVLPHFLEGVVCKGFGRGSKELGIPTANFDHKVIQNLPSELDCGIYYGLANVNNGPIYKAVLSIGWNPFYQNDKKSVETHILHDFDGDFYGAKLKVAILGHIRPERDFLSLDDLIAEIKNDIKIADEKLELNEISKYRTHQFFQVANGDINL